MKKQTDSADITTAFIKQYSDTGAVYRKQITVTDKVWEAFKLALQAEVAQETDHYRKANLSKQPTGNPVRWLNLDQAEYFVTWSAKLCDVKCNKERLKIKANGYNTCIKVLSSLILILFMAACSKPESRPERRQETQQAPVLVPYFHPMQVLMPDYVCSDTLIVINADQLNYDMGKVEQGIIEATDYQIDSILHNNCQIK